MICKMILLGSIYMNTCMIGGLSIVEHTTIQLNKLYSINVSNVINASMNKYSYQIAMFRTREEAEKHRDYILKLIEE